MKELEKTCGGPETAAAEQPKLTTTTTVNRTSFHVNRYCESYAKAIAKLSSRGLANVYKGLSDGAEIWPVVSPHKS